MTGWAVNISGEIMGLKEEIAEAWEGTSHYYDGRTFRVSLIVNPEDLPDLSYADEFPLEQRLHLAGRAAEAYALGLFDQALKEVGNSPNLSLRAVARVI